jgi:hypothetical protein
MRFLREQSRARSRRVGQLPRRSMVLPGELHGERPRLGLI